MDETKVVNLGDEEKIREMWVNIHLEAKRKQELIKFLKDVFAWSYENLLGLSTNIV